MRKKKIATGYIKIYAPNHPRKDNCGFVLEHIIVMEESIGRHISPTESIHHINRIRDDNKIENLKLYPSHKEHFIAEHLPELRREDHEKVRRFSFTGKPHEIKLLKSHAKKNKLSLSRLIRNTILEVINEKKTN